MCSMVFIAIRRLALLFLILDGKGLCDGDLVILAYSGRTKLSVGADYREMSEIARRMFPDIRTLMNVDGGGSAVLGMVVNGSFMELSCPSTSTDSCVGMTRPVNTVLYIPVGG